MISFIVRLPSAIFTRGRSPSIPFGEIEEVGKRRAIDPSTGQPFKGPSLAWELIEVKADEIVELQDKIKGIKVLEKERDGHLETIEDAKRHLARWEREAESIKDELRKALADHSSMVAEIAEVDKKIREEKYFIEEYGSPSAEVRLRDLETKRIDLDMDREYVWKKIKQLTHELWGVNQLKQPHQKRIDSALVEISRLNREIENLKENLPAEVNRTLVDMQTDLKEELTKNGLYPEILDDPHFGPTLRSAFTPIEL